MKRILLTLHYDEIIMMMIPGKTMLFLLNSINKNFYRIPISKYQIWIKMVGFIILRIALMVVVK